MPNEPDRHPDESDYPVLRWADLWGIDPDFTGDKSTDEWLEEQRGEA